MRGKSLENEERERKGISSLMHLITDDVLRSDEYRVLAIYAQFLAECIKLLEITRSKNKLTTIMKRKNLQDYKQFKEHCQHLIGGDLGERARSRTEHRS